MYFNAKRLPATQLEYVAWLDVMGIGPVMGRSLDAAANFVFKIHVAALKAPFQGVTLYPVMDGLYACAPSQAALFAFMASVFEQCADEFASKKPEDSLHRFIIRAAIAFGPVIHGASVPDAAFKPAGEKANPVAANPTYKNAILMGLPMVQAHECERLAPPFGVYVHESARAFAPQGENPLHQVWWRWASPADGTWKRVLNALREHYEYFSKRSRSLQYDADRMKVHREMAEEYFVQSA
jgi:hypothetical protein